MKNIGKILLILFVGISLWSCTKDWLDINKDPNSPTTPEIKQLLSFGERYMTMSLTQGNFLGTSLSTYTHHIAAREVDNYGMDMQANNILNSWNYFYIYALKNFDAIIAFAEENDNLIYAGVAKTLKAYTFSIMVDLWGDIPYTEFNVPGLISPKPDSSKDIYNSLFTLLDEGLANLQNTSAANRLKPGSDDFFYAGNVATWVKLNNTIKLKMLLQSRKAKSDITDWQSKLSALISANNFIASGEDFQFWFNDKTTPSDMRHPAFLGYTGQHTFYVSPYFYEMMSGDTYNMIDNPFEGIKDPRIPYYFYNQLAPGANSTNPHEYRNGTFMSRFFASNGPNNAVSNDPFFTKIGIYPCGGRYDTGTGGAVSLTTGNGAAPHKMITFFAVKFMLAELALTGEITADAKTLFQEAMVAAFTHVNSVVAKQTGVPQLTNVNRDAYITSILGKYDAADAAGKLKIVMIQKWIANFMNPIDCYTDYRRTGYPTLFDPAKTQDPGFGVNPTPTDRSPARVPMLNITQFPRSLYYPTNSESSLNPNMPQRTNLPAPFIFWDK